MTKTKEITQSALCVVLFTYLGVLTRLSLTLLSDLAPDTLLPKLGSGFFLANIYGSFVMGLMSPLVDYFQGRLYWHLGVLSGFCGSCTTFSTWQKTTADLMVSNRIIDSLIMSLSTFSTSYMALLFGKNLGQFLSRRLIKFKRNPRTYTEETRSSVEEPKETRFSLNLDAAVVLVFVVLINVALWTGVFLDGQLWRRQWWVAMALGPIGSLIRYYLGLYNKNFPKFPVFTFLVNVVASVLAMLFLVVEHFLGPASNSMATYDFWAISGVATGILGSLSTVSTFVNELDRFASGNSVGYAFRYGLASFFVSQILCIVVGCVKFFG